MSSSTNNDSYLILNFHPRQGKKEPQLKISSKNSVKILQDVDLGQKLFEYLD